MDKVGTRKPPIDLMIVANCHRTMSTAWRVMNSVAFRKNAVTIQCYKLSIIKEVL